MKVFFFLMFFVSLIILSRQLEPYVNINTRTIGLSHEKTLGNIGDAIRVRGYGSISHVAVPGGPTSISGALRADHLSSGNSLAAEITKSNRGLGTDVNVMGKANVFENENAKLDGAAYYSRNSRSGLETVGTNMKLSHQLSGSGLEVDLSRTNQGVGTNLNVGYNVNVLKSENPKLEIGAQYSKNLDSGSKPSFGAKATLKLEF